MNRLDLIETTQSEDKTTKCSITKKEVYMSRYISLMVVLTALLLPMAALAKPLVSVSITAEKEVTVVKSGQKVTKKVAASKINPDDVIFYTLNYINSGNEAATSVILDDPIPMGTVYLPGSAFGDGAEVTFSIDNGKSFKKPSLLVYEVKGANGQKEKRTASPEEYTHVRWIIGKIEAGAKGTVGFQVRIKR
jgi:uncharacterized repeat protein (TIGR01451 family)